MKRRRLLAAAVVLASAAALALIAAVTGRTHQSTWPEQAKLGCSEGSFGLPDSLLPPELTSLLGDRSAQKAAEVRAEVSTTLDDLIVNSFPDTPLNLNCERGAYDPNAINVYVIARDHNERFKWAEKRIVTLSDTPHVLILGQEFWNFFNDAWQPILRWRGEVSDKDWLAAFGEFTTELYQFYLQWAIAHELGHMKLGHYEHRAWWPNSEQPGIELAADIEAARSLRRIYSQITPQLLALINETMKYHFRDTYQRDWTSADGEAFKLALRNGLVESDWNIRIEDCSATHPPFLIRSISMLEAASSVALEDNPQSQWQAAVQELSLHLKKRVVVHSRWIKLCP
jgi:hypothetical protein